MNEVDQAPMTALVAEMAGRQVVRFPGEIPPVGTKLYAGDPSYDGYVEAFYELAALMGLTARTESPAQVWAEVMQPKLRELFAKKGPSA